MRIYYKYLLFAILFGVIYSSLAGGEFDKFSDIVLFFGFKQFEIRNYEIFRLLQKIFPFIFLQIVFGTYIYRHFCTAAIYHFTRVSNRCLWFLKECAYLFVYTNIYMAIMFFSGLVMIGLKHDFVIDTGSIVLFVYYFFITTLFLYFLTLMTNVIAIQINSTVSFIINSGYVLFFVSLFIFWDGKLYFSSFAANTPLEIIQRDAIILKFNLLSHIMLNWHSSKIDEVNALINGFGINFDLNFSVFLFATLSILAILLGIVITKRKEFISNNNESNM